MIKKLLGLAEVQRVKGTDADSGWVITPVCLPELSMRKRSAS